MQPPRSAFGLFRFLSSASSQSRVHVPLPTPLSFPNPRHSPPLPHACLTLFQIANPHATQSDSFYFVDGALVMHNKASYAYIVEDRAQAKRSYDYLNPDKASSASAKVKAGAARQSVVVGHGLASFSRRNRRKF